MLRIQFSRLAVVGALWFGATLFGASAFELPWENRTANGTDKEIYKASDHSGAVFVVEAYFLDCHFCNENAHNVDKLQDHYQGNSKVQILDVGVDTSEDDYAEWINRHHPNHPVLNDGHEKLIRQLGTSGYPSTYILDKNFQVVYETSGVWEGSTRDEIIAAIDGAVQE